LPGVSSDRRGVAGLLILLFGITYLDRVCISVAGPRMQADLHIDPIGWGWVTGVFTLAYCIFEIPTGVMGDRIGPRRVLTRIVLWWVPIQIRYGWRMSFYVFGAAGLVWAAVWYAWFRDSPEERGHVSFASAAGTESSRQAHPFPWRLACRSSTVCSLIH
jgi:sugar phosphate permease